MYRVCCAKIFSCLIVLFSLIAVSLPLPAQAGGAAIVVKVDISQQKMNLFVKGEHHASWPISTGWGYYRTPVGVFRPQRMHRSYFSKKYYNSPMPHSIFFHKGFAIHGTSLTMSLGRPASHGCVRLRKNHAAYLFELVKKHGPGATRIVIAKRENSSPRTTPRRFSRKYLRISTDSRPKWHSTRSTLFGIKKPRYYSR